MPKVSLEGVTLFQSLWDSNLETSTMRKPVHPVGNRFITEHRKHFLRERHVFDLGGMNITGLCRDDAKVAVRVVHESLWFLDNLDHTGFDGILVFDAFEARLSDLTHLFGLLSVFVRLQRAIRYGLRLTRGVHGYSCCTVHSALTGINQEIIQNTKWLFVLLLE